MERAIRTDTGVVRETCVAVNLGDRDFMPKLIDLHRLNDDNLNVGSPPDGHVKRIDEVIGVRKTVI
jgi:hypothetical protein